MTAPSYPLTMPVNVGIRNSEFGLRRSVGITVSPFSGHQQVYKNSLALWYAVFSLPPMNRASAGQWQAFFSELNGRYGTFLAGDQDAKAIMGTAVTSVLVNGAHAIGANTVAMDGFAISTNNVFKKGDYVQFGSGATSKLHLVTADINSNGSGQANVQIEPILKAALTDNDVVVYSSAKAVFKLDTNDVTWSANNNGIYTMSFSCTEFI
tara:strand:+ start:612 stop:1238 length:627 start_codon:yes stop_codon:yes gene_type:complete